MNELHLFAGVGGGILGGILCGHTPVCAVERDVYAIDILLQRQRDGILPKFPIWNDIVSFKGSDWKGKANIVSGGFPCQDVSSAGEGRGLSGGTKSILWREMARVVWEVQPEFVFVENSPNLTKKGLGVVLGDLAAMGYDAEWDVFSAKDFGACHVRERMWILATNPNRPQCKGGRVPCGIYSEHPIPSGAAWWKNQPSIHRVDDGVAHRMDRLRTIGNGQVPTVVRYAFNTLKQRLSK